MHCPRYVTQNFVNYLSHEVSCQRVHLLVVKLHAKYFRTDCSLETMSILIDSIAFKVSHLFCAFCGFVLFFVHCFGDFLFCFVCLCLFLLGFLGPSLGCRGLWIEIAPLLSGRATLYLVGWTGNPGFHPSPKSLRCWLQVPQPGRPPQLVGWTLWGGGVHTAFCFVLVFFCIPQLYLWGSPLWVRFLRMWPFFNPTIKVVTFRLRGWCVLGVFLLPAFTRLGHERQDLLSPCNENTASLGGWAAKRSQRPGWRRSMWPNGQVYSQPGATGQVDWTR